MRCDLELEPNRPDAHRIAAPEESLLIIWSSGDVDTAQRMVFMYSRNSMLHSWWQGVQFCVWLISVETVACLWHN